MWDFLKSNNFLVIIALIAIWAGLVNIDQIIAFAKALPDLIP